MSNDESDRIHVRGVYYTVYMSDMDVEPPTNCSWDSYDNTQKCYLEECAVLARILGYIPLDGIINKRADTRTITEYGAHTVRPDSEGLPAPTGVATPLIPHHLLQPQNTPSRRLERRIIGALAIRFLL